MRPFLLAATVLASYSLTPLAPALAQTATQAAAPADVLGFAPVPQGKLTDAVTPSAYRLDLTIDPRLERFQGHTEIDANIKAPTRFIDLHGRDLNVARAVARIGGRLHPATYTQVDPTGVVRLTFGSTLPAGPVTLIFDYDAAFGDGASGLYRIKVGEEWFAWTQFQSIDARAAFPGFDEPGFKTPFDVTLRAPEGQLALTNSPDVGSPATANGMTVHRFQGSLPLPTYLVAFVVGPMTTLAGAAAPTPQRATPLPVRIVTTPNNAGKLDFALQGTGRIIALLENYFGTAFPFPKLDQITSPVMPGAMENAGADIYGDNLLIMDENAPVAQKKTFGMVVAHELAHQWFGDLVTPAWWTDIWLNESFANWMGFRIGDEWRPDLKIGAGALDEGFVAMRTDQLVAGRPIRQPITRNAEIDAAFDSITYGKGGHVVAMIANYLGDEKFRNGVRLYMDRHKYGSASSDDFFAALGEAGGDPRVGPAMRSFIDQQGVPLITLARSGTGWTASQSRYSQIGVTAPATQWLVPVCLRGATGSSCTMVDQATVSVPGPGPVMPNAGGTGYYRFELPRADWDGLIARAATLPSGEGQALADSLAASFAAGRASPTQVLRLARNLAASKDSYARAASLVMPAIWAGNGFFDARAQAAYDQFIIGLARPVLAELGFNPAAGAYSGEDPDRSVLRQTTIAALTGVEDKRVSDQLATAAAAYLAGDRAALDNAYLGAGLRAYVAKGGSAAVRSLASAALASEEPYFRGQALGALASTGDADIARWLLDEFEDPRLRMLERFNLTSAVVQNSETQDLGYDWLKANFAKVDTSGGIFMRARLPGVLGGFCSVERAAQIAADFTDLVGTGTGALSLQRTIEKVRNCGLLKQARAAEVSAAMKAFK